jgi:hypothetical protein
LFAVVEVLSVTADHPKYPLRHFFAGVAEYAFETRVGMADPPLIDYITDLLTRFISSDALYSMRDLTGHRLGEVDDMLAEAEARIGEARRDVHRHIGDFTLFWAGVYPEALGPAPLSKRLAKDRFVDYCQQGKKAYYIASTLPSDTEDVQSELLERLSNEFELCAFGLNEARKEWERRDAEGGWQLVVFN